MVGKFIKGIIILLGVLVFVIMLVYFVWDGSKIITWSQSGFVLCSVYQLDNGRTSFAFVDQEDFTGPPYPAAEDTLLTIADSTASIDRWIEVLETPHTPGKEAVITFQHKGTIHSTTMKTRPVQRAHFHTLIVLQVLKLLISLSFVALGFLAYFRRPDSLAVRALMLYCFAMAASVVRTYMPMFPVMAWFQIPYQGIIQAFLLILTFFFSSFWLLLNFVFPRPVQLIRTRPWLAYALCFAPQVILAAISIAKGSIYGIQFLLYAVTALQVIAGLLILRHNFVHATNTLEKRQTRLVLWGSGVSLIMFLIYSLYNIGLVRFMMPLTHRLLIYDVIFLAILASPFSIAYAIRRYRLMEVEARLRRGTRFLMVTAFLLVIFFAVLYAFSQLLLKTLNIESQTPTLGVALLLALMFAPLHRRLKKLVEHRFYPERLKLRLMLEELIANASAMPDRATLWSRLEDRLKQGLGIKSVIPVLRNGDGRCFQSTNGEQVPLNPDGALVKELERTSGSLICDECMATDKMELSAEERKWLEENKAALLLPMTVSSRLIGFLGITFEEGREDMAAEDIGILTSVASQVALQSENLRLVEENFDKRRLEEQLHTARQVQERFLPSQLPKTPGLSVAARFLSSYEVAGDYYDVIPLDNNRTMIAVGDVSGKGAGAAMIMATVQASLRSMAKAGVPLKDIVASINDLIDANTTTEQFVTFFAAIYHPTTKTLTSVNAGHNPPRIIRDDNTVTELQVGGPLLGVFAGAPYEEETVTMKDGDLLIAFTDGVSEAMNNRDQEFGEDRIIEIAQRIHREPPGTILQVLEKEVAAFRGNRPLEDDFTLLLVKAEPQTRLGDRELTIAGTAQK
jgi:sigma-B regulation protein RsbU (phosphoserine phosphatase)